MKTNGLLFCFFLLVSIGCQTTTEEKTAEKPNEAVSFNSNDYEDLVTLFKEWRNFEKPPMLKGAPDYTAATFEKRMPRFLELQQGLQAIDTSNWSVPIRWTGWSYGLR